MSFSLLVPFLLAASWLIPALVVGVLYWVQRRPDAASESPPMDTSLRGRRAEVLDLDLHAPATGWRSADWDGPGARVRARVTDASCEVLVLTAYAESTVPVRSGADRGARRCVLCLN
jgi:uncharacterized iron-regulated membrane protein